MAEKKDTPKPTTRSGGRAGKDRDTVPVTGKRGQEERDAAAVRTSGIHTPNQR